MIFSLNNDLDDLLVPAVKDYLQEKLGTGQDAKDTLAHTRAIINARTTFRCNANIRFSISDWVQLHRLNQVQGHSDKLRDTLEGFYQIISIQDIDYTTNCQLALP